MSFEPGTVIAGKYQIERRLGEGGMGEVFAARRLSIDDVVALKVLHGHLRAQTELARRFVQEARAAARIKHAGVVRILDAAEESETPLWIAMELLEGESLERRLARGPLSPDEITALFSQILDVLEQVHRAGIVHRDLKPSNVFLEHSAGPRLQVRLLDFGIAKLTDSKLGTYATQTNTFMGSPGYMSPEQIKQVKEVDARTDLYAVGVMLYECLSGALPYEADTFGQLLAKQLTEPPRQLPESPDPRLRYFGELAIQCLAVDPGARPADAAALHAALQRAPTAAQGPTSTQSPAPPQSGPTKSKSSQEWWFYALGPAVALLLGALSLGGGGKSAKRPATQQGQQNASGSTESTRSASSASAHDATPPSTTEERATASHILITYSGSRRTPAGITRSKEEARALAEEVAALAAKPGAKFAELAEKYTEDPSGKGHGGRLGTFPRGRMVPDFDQAVFALRPHEVSGVVETAFGFHVVYREPTGSAAAKPTLTREPTSPDPLAGKFTLAQAIEGLPTEGSLRATLETSYGTLTCKLFPDKVPNTVANFVGLARGLRPFWDPYQAAWVKRPLYDGTNFHRVIAGFMIQGGDVLRDGTGGIGYEFPDELVPGLTHDRAGLLCMANRGPNTNGGQFFITDAATPHLTQLKSYTIFGECTPLELIAKIARAPRESANSERPEPALPITAVTITRE